MQNLDTDVQSLGGGMGGGGFGLGGGGGSNPLLWLITLAFLGDKGGLLGGKGDGGVAALTSTENSAKLDCLAQSNVSLQSQINATAQDSRFQNLNDNINNLAGIERDTADTVFRQTTFLSQQNAEQAAAAARQLAECCCELQKEVQATQTAIALQTNILTMNANENTQKILDNLCNSRIENLQAQNANLQREIQTAELRAACGGGGPGNSGS